MKVQAERWHGTRVWTMAAVGKQWPEGHGAGTGFENQKYVTWFHHVFLMRRYKVYARVSRN
jgi:hypothetical protein